VVVVVVVAGLVVVVVVVAGPGAVVVVVVVVAGVGAEQDPTNVKAPPDVTVIEPKTAHTLDVLAKA
jgi:hypothetical protein